MIKFVQFLLTKSCSSVKSACLVVLQIVQAFLQPLLIFELVKRVSPGRHHQEACTPYALLHLPI